ncbi:hypothetical protein BY996DRAFT_6415096 [Phakopsora pachyrhizi]|nr:hypothetical protein BY996DRAFT_6415096 [Phakopsora pachyrhizi]
MVEDFKSHPLFKELQNSDPEFYNTLEQFKLLEDPKDWGDNSLRISTQKIATSCISSIKKRLSQEKFGPIDIFNLQIIKYLGYFNPRVRAKLKAELFGDINDASIQIKAWRRMIKGDYRFRQFPRNTAYPKRFHEFLEQTHLEFMLLSTKNGARGAGEEFSALEPTEVNASIENPAKLVYLALNHIYEHNLGTVEPIIELEHLMKRSVDIKKSIYSHVLLNTPPEETGTMKLLKDMKFLSSLDPEMQRNVYEYERLSDPPEKDGINPFAIDIEELIKSVQKVDPQVKISMVRDLVVKLEKPEFRGQLKDENQHQLSADDHLHIASKKGVSESRQRNIGKIHGTARWPSVQYQKTYAMWSDPGLVKDKNLKLLLKMKFELCKEIEEYRTRLVLVLRTEALVKESLNSGELTRKSGESFLKFLTALSQIWLEVGWNPIKGGSYGPRARYIGIQVIQLISEHSFGKLPINLHRSFEDLIAHLTATDKTGQLLKVFNSAYQDITDYRVYAFFKRPVPHNFLSSDIDPDDTKAFLDQLSKSLR